MDRVLKDLQAFFVEYPFVGLVLPDGWFGRPYDNRLQFTRAEMRGDELRIQFAQEETVILTGDFQVEVTGESLAIRDFSTAEWQWKGSGPQGYPLPFYWFSGEGSYFKSFFVLMMRFCVVASWSRFRG